MDPQWITAACAGAGLLITWSSSIAGAVIWLTKRLDANKKEILADFEAKHNANTQSVEALRTLVMRHDILLDPEFTSNGRISRAGGH